MGSCAGLVQRPAPSAACFFWPEETWRSCGCRLWKNGVGRQGRLKPTTSRCRMLGAGSTLPRETPRRLEWSSPGASASVAGHELSSSLQVPCRPHTAHSIAVPQHTIGQIMYKITLQSGKGKQKASSKRRAREADVSTAHSHRLAQIHAFCENPHDYGCIASSCSRAFSVSTGIKYQIGSCPVRLQTTACALDQVFLIRSTVDSTKLSSGEARPDTAKRW